MRVNKILAGVCVGMVAAWLALAPSSGARQDSGVRAEAVGQANLRSGPGIEYPVVGEIVAGTRYPVLARHALVPWLKLEYNQGEAWVYTELVTITGDLALVPLADDFDSVEVTPSSPPPAQTVESAATPTAAPTLTPTVAGPVATTLGEANVRFGPGLEYPSIIEVPEGTSLRVLEFHSLYPWVHVALTDGSGWIFNDVITISGDTSRVPTTNATQFGYPTLTPTPQTLAVAGAPWQNAPQASGTLANTLGKAINAYLLEQKFAPFTDRIASVFVLDLNTGDTFTLNGGIAYSGMSLTKIPILVTYFQRHSGPLSMDEAFLIGDTMMCSENITTNQLLEQIGDGDSLRGAQAVTALMQQLDLRGTFILRQYVILQDEEPAHVGTITTGFDQSSTQPDPSNQVMPQDLGWLLASVYQCAEDGTGLLTERYPGDFTVQECRQMLYAMDADSINVFIEAGVPAGTRVIHKHGWIDDTHGDAGIVIGPDSAYVLVTTLYEEGHLLFNESSSPTIAELSRMVWNALNPSAPVEQTTIGIVPGDCDPLSTDVINTLMTTNLPMPGP